MMIDENTSPEECERQFRRARNAAKNRKPTFEDLKTAAKKLMQIKGRPAAIDLIHHFGATQLATLAESKYAEFIASAEAAVNTPAEPDPVEPIVLLAEACAEILEAIDIIAQDMPRVAGRLETAREKINRIRYG